MMYLTVLVASLAKPVFLLVGAAPVLATTSAPVQEPSSLDLQKDLKLILDITNIYVVSS